jgi:RsiW-degrading membrane proteinase PrsW (M82 family)
VARVLVLVAALGIVAAGLLGCGGAVLYALLEPGSDQVQIITLGISLLALTLVLGPALAWQSWQSIQGRESGRFRISRIWLLAVGYILALVAGQVFLSSGLLTHFAFPPLHVAAATLPPLIILGLVGRVLRERARWRSVVLQLSSGAMLSTALAFTLEVILGLILVAVVAAILALQAGGLETIEAVVEGLQDPAWLQDPANLVPIVSLPPVVGGIFLLVAGIVPLVEEGVKTLGVVLLSYQRPGLRRAFLWGVASGAGFAMTENLLNTTSDLDSWAPLVLLRVGASLLHCFTGGVAGMAWHQLLVERRWARGLGLFAASITLHALWNALAAAMALTSLWTLGGAASEADRAVLGLGSALTLALLIGLALAAGLGLLGSALYLRRRGLSEQVARGEGSGSPVGRGETESTRAEGF